VPIVHVQDESAYPGGAANVARNLLPFAGSVAVIGVLGHGPQGDLLMENFAKEGLDTSHLIREEGRETIVKTRVLAKSQQMVRIDRERPQKISPQVMDQVLATIDRLLPEMDGVILEDYAKGMLSQELVTGIVARVRKHKVMITVDPNPNNAIDWGGVTVIKPNRTEAFRAAGIQEAPVAPSDPKEDKPLLEVAQLLLKKWSCKFLMITLGEQGMLLVSAGGECLHVPPKAREVFDVSGAGDTAIALLTLALCADASVEEAAGLSNQASSIVVGKVGTATITPEELLASLEEDSA